MSKSLGLIILLARLKFCWRILNFAGVVFEAKVAPARDPCQQNSAGVHQKILSFAKKGRQKNECTSVVGHFNGHSGAMEQYRRYCQMLHIQGYPESHWMLPSGDYSLHIAPVAARATANKMTTKNGPTLLAILMAAAVHRYNTVHIAQ
jgi:hypothetical protein